LARLIAFNGHAMTIEPKTELEAAALVASGDLPSPFSYRGQSELFAMRISGTGTAYRSAHDEYCFRDPAIWLSEELLRRCLAIPCIVGHPSDGVLSGDEFIKRVIGIIVFTYVRGSELWGVLRCLNREATIELLAHDYDSSPSCVFEAGDNIVLRWHDGKPILVENFPVLIDHVAICEVGVWTRGGEPGIEISPEVKELENA
jgi:hypothetical protein